jgi:transposase IS4-like protein/DDE family transposase
VAWVTREAKAARDRVPDRVAVGVLTKTFPPERVDAAVEQAGAWEQRRRDLPARLTAYFVLAMWLWREHGYEEVLRQLSDGMTWAGLKDDELDQAGGDVPFSGSITKARQRLGPRVLELLFRQASGPMGTLDTPGVFWRGRRLTAIDGFTLDLPDSPANREEFSGPTGGPFPQVRVVAHAEVGTRGLIDAAFGGYGTGEQSLARDLIASLASDMLVIVDRGFAGYELWQAMAATGADLLVRMSEAFTLPVTTVLDDGSYLSVLRCRGKPPITVRVIEYTVMSTEVGKDGSNKQVSELFCLATTMLDPQQAPIEEIPGLYAQRWEGETVIGAVKTALRGGIGVRLRSHAPEGVRQEVWALLCVYQALSELIVGAAQRHRLDPDQVSFVRARNLARRSVHWIGAVFSP